MPTVATRPSSEPAVGELLVLTCESPASQVVIAPRRGALVTSFSVAGRELLYLDPPTLSDAHRNVRGGIPVLFPSPGKLEGDAFRSAGRSGSLKQHGFARNLAWTLVATHAHGDRAEAELELVANETTLEGYPWEFRMELGFKLQGACLSIESRIKNESAAVMPFALGYHPYFHVTDKSRASIDARATRAFDNVTKQAVPFSGFDLQARELDLHLLDHQGSQIALHLGDGSRIELRGSRDFSLWVVWTLADKDYVCVEPWTAPGNALNSGERLIELPPGAWHRARVDIEFLG